MKTAMRGISAPGGWRGAFRLVAGVATGLAVAALQASVYPGASKALVAALESPGTTSAARVAGLVAFVFAVKVAIQAGNVAGKVLQSHLTWARVSALKKSLLRRLLLAPPGFHCGAEPERVLERLENGVDESVPFFATLPVTASASAVSFAWALRQMFCGSPDAFVRWGLLESPQPGNPSLAWMAVATAALFVAATALFEKRKARLFRESRMADEDVRGVSSESLRGIQDLRSAGAFQFATGRIFGAIDRCRVSSLRFQALQALFSGAGGLAVCLAETAVLAGAAWLMFGEHSSFAYSDYAGFSALCESFNMSALSLFGLWQEARKAMLARARIKDVASLPEAFAAGKGETAAAPSGLEFRDVAFSAPDGAEILRGVSLVVRPGEHVALVGPSGCGKSTLLKLAMRHLEAGGGKVSFAGTDIDKWEFSAFASRVAYVSQRPFLFEGTIRENIVMGRNLGLDDAGILEIASDIGLLDDLRRKAETPEASLGVSVGPDGRSLSGGQAAKVALCRALAGNPDLLLLDEVTAPLDELSQERVAKFLSGPKCRDKAMLSISHRLPAVRGMDRIVVMDAGRIVQDGTWEELSSRPGMFADLVARETGVAGPRGARAAGGPPAPPRPDSAAAAMPAADIRRALSLSPVFADCGGEALARLAAGAETEAAAAGTLLLRKGDAGDALYVVASGKVDIAGRSYGPGHAFGEIALFGGLKRSADVRVAEDSSFAVLRRDDVLAACRADPELSLRVLSALARIAERA